jgi:hypothetical protein
MGLVMVGSGKITTIVLDHEVKLMEFHLTNFFCNTKKKIYDMKDIRDVKRGHEGV